MSDNRQIAEVFLKSVNEREWGSFLDHLTPDCEYIYANAARASIFNEGELTRVLT